MAGARARRTPPVLAVLTALTLSACGGGASSDTAQSEDEDWPKGTINIIYPTKPGGGQDQNIGQFLPFFGEELGASFRGDYKPGASGAIGLTLASRSAPDCNTLVVLNHPTGSLFSHLSQKDAEYTYDDFDALGGLVTDPTTWVVRNDAPWQTMEELVAAAKKQPGKLTLSISQYASNYYVAALQLEEATGAKFNVVAFDGGGAARTAVVSGEVDATAASVFIGASVDAETKVLAVQAPENKWPDKTDNAPTLNEALGTDLPDNSYQHTLAVPASCAKEHPGRFDKLVAAFDAARTSDGYKEALEKTNEANKVDTSVGPDDFDEYVEGEQEVIEGLIAENEELQPQ